jgi:nucleotide-binding universal stress UspA family protein
MTDDRTQRVLVLYDDSSQGRAALTEAATLASARDAPLTVLAVMPRERDDIGCARCRQGAVIWNHELGEIAEEQLAAAAAMLGRSTAIEYEIARGPLIESITSVARRDNVVTLVLPARRRHVLTRFSRDQAGRLRRAGPWEVVVAPATATDPVGARSS